MVASSPEIELRHPRRLMGPGHDVARESPLEEGHREPEGVPDEAQRFAEHQPDLQASQVDLLEARGRQPHHGRPGDGQQQRPQPVSMAFDQDAVDEEPQEGGGGEVGDHQGEARQDHEDQRGPGPGEPSDHAEQRAWAAPSA